MTTINVYRVEDAEGKGPFLSNRGSDAYDNYHECLIPFHSCHRTVPRLVDDAEKGTDAATHLSRHGEDATFMAGRYRFGFASIEQALSAFPCPAGRAAMGKVGFRLAVFEVEPEDFLAANTQCLFRRDRARPAPSLNLRNLTAEPQPT